MLPLITGKSTGSLWKFLGVIFISFFTLKASPSFSKEYCRFANGPSVDKCFVPIQLGDRKLEVDARHLSGSPNYTILPPEIDEMILIGYSKNFSPRNNENEINFKPYSYGEYITVIIRSYSNSLYAKYSKFSDFSKVHKSLFKEKIGEGFYKDRKFILFNGISGVLRFFPAKSSIDICFGDMKSTRSYCESYFDRRGLSFKASYSPLLFDEQSIFISNILAKWAEFEVDEFTAK